MSEIFNPYNLPSWREITPAPDGIITEFTITPPFKKINSAIFFNGSVPIDRNEVTVSSDGGTATFSTTPLDGDLLSAYGA
jgi:hypothetical protein